MTLKQLGATICFNHETQHSNARGLRTTTQNALQPLQRSSSREDIFKSPSRNGVEFYCKDANTRRLAGTFFSRYTDSHSLS